MGLSDESAPPAHPASVIQLEALEYATLRLMIRDVEVLVLQAQAAIARATTTRDQYVATLGQKYGFDPAGLRQLQWNDDTREFRFQREG